MLFALCSETPLVSPSELWRMAPALERNAQHCALAWGLAPPAVVVVDDASKLPPSCQPVVFVAHEGDPGTLAVHYADPLLGPAARVYCDAASGLAHGRYSICEAAAHEITEALVDPYVNRWADHPDPTRALAGVQVALEVADPVQTTYGIDHAGKRWPVANFVTPAWFDGRLSSEPGAVQHFLDAGGRFDHSGELAYPGQVGPEGYVVLRAPRDDGGTRVWSEAREPAQVDARPSVRTAALRHPWSRTRRRGCETP